jgi:molybdopterin converting factor small subunit
VEIKILFAGHVAGGGRSRMLKDLPEGSTLAEVLNLLPSLLEEREDSSLPSWREALLFVNDQQVLDTSSCVLCSGDELLVLSPISGG